MCLSHGPLCGLSAILTKTEGCVGQKIKKKERKKEGRKLCCHCSEPCKAGSTLELHVGRWDERGMDRLESVEGQEGKKKERRKENKKERKKEGSSAATAMSRVKLALPWNCM